jgi:hypothetical protein
MNNTKLELKKAEIDNFSISPVRIIASNQGETNDPEGKWQDYIDIKAPSLLTINANASALYSGAIANAGIRLYVKIDGNLIASDMCFEGESSTITFFSSTSTTIFLKPGRYNLEVDRQDIRTNGDFKLSVNYYAVYARKYRVLD